MIRLQIVNLLPERHRPDVLTDELDHVELVREQGAVACEAFAQALADAEAELFEAYVDALAEEVGWLLGLWVGVLLWEGLRWGLVEGVGWGGLFGECGCEVGGCGGGRRLVVVERGLIPVGELFGERNEFDKEEVEAGCVQ